MFLNILNRIFLVHFLDANYNITWKRDTSATYKFFSKTHSILVPNQRNVANPWRYPFADIFIYTYDKEHDILAYRNQWRKLRPGLGFNATMKWPKGTVLTRFGDFKARISVENKKYLYLLSKNWYNVGLTQWYDHYNNYLSHERAFEIPQFLYSPAKPFSIPPHLSDCSCNEIT